MSGQGVLHLQLMGGAKLWVGKPETEVRLSTTKGMGLLAYLAMQPGFTQSRAKLADVLWGDRADTMARQSLRQTLMLLRRDLGAFDFAIKAEARTVALASEHVAVDVLQFLELGTSNAAEDRLKCLDLPWGKFLDGFHTDSDAFEEWALVQRHRIEAVAIRTFSELARGCEAREDFPRALIALERLVSIDPAEEDWHRRLLRLEAKYRGTDAALARAKTLAADLKRELDAKPSATTLALIEEIRRAGEREREERREPTLVASTEPPASVVPPNGELLSAAEPHAERDAPVSQDAGVLLAKQTQAPAWRRPLVLAAAAACCLAILLAAGLWESFSRAPATGASANADSAKWRSPTQGIAASDARKLRLDGQISPIIVLPFDAPDAPSLAGMAGLVTGDLINALSRISALRVMSRGTSFAYKGKATDPAVIAAETGVRYVLEGTIRELDERRVRVQVELIETATRLAVWSDRIEGSRDERGKAVDDIVLSLARGLHMETVQLEGSRRGPDTGGVGDLISKGWASTFGAARSPQKLKAAQDYFNEALEKSPGHPAAQTGLAAVYVTSVAEMHTGERAALLAKADKLLREVLAQRPDFYSAIYYQGLLFKLRNNMDKALQNFARAVQINPSDAGAYAQIGNILMQTGKPAEALEHVRYAMRLGPKDPVLPIWLRMAGEIELELDHLTQAKEYIIRSLELSPGAPRSWATLAAIGALTDDRQEAKRAAAELRKLLAAPSDPAVLQRFARGSPDDPNARKLIRGLRQALAF